MDNTNNDDFNIEIKPNIKSYNSLEELNDYKDLSKLTWYIGDSYAHVDSHGVKRIYQLHTPQKLFLLFHDPTSCGLGRFVNGVILLAIVISSINFIFDTADILQYQPSECSNPVCNNTALCPGYMVCRPIPLSWTQTVDLACILIFTIDFGFRILFVGFVPARLSGLVPENVDDFDVESHDLNNDKEVIEYSVRVIDDYNSKQAAIEKHNISAMSDSTDETKYLLSLMASGTELMRNAGTDIIRNTGSVVSQTVKTTGSVVSNTVKTTGSVVSNTVKSTGTVVSNTVKSTGAVVSNTVKSTGHVISHLPEVSRKLSTISDDNTKRQNSKRHFRSPIDLSNDSSQHKNENFGVELTNDLNNKSSDDSNRNDLDKYVISTALENEDDINPDDYNSLFTTRRNSLITGDNKEDLENSYVKAIMNEDIVKDNFTSEDNNDADGTTKAKKKKKRFKISNIYKYIINMLNVVVPNKDNTSETDIDYKWNVKIIFYAVTIFSIIDMATIIPFYVQYATSSGTSLSFLRVLRLVRVIKVFNFSKLFRNGVFALTSTMQKSLEPLTIVSFFIALGIVFLASLVFFFEEGNFAVTETYPQGAYLIEANLGGQVASSFRSIPVSMYFAVFTSTTVGYGDIYPLSIGGKITAILTMYFGVVLIALPITVIGNNFNKIYHKLIGEDTEVVVYKALVDLLEVYEKEIDVMSTSNYTKDCHSEIMNKIMVIVSTLDDTQRDKLIDKLQAQIKLEQENVDFKSNESFRTNENNFHEENISKLIKELLTLGHILETLK